MLRKHFLLLTMLKTVVLLNILVENPIFSGFTLDQTHLNFFLIRKCIISPSKFTDFVLLEDTTPLINQWGKVYSFLSEITAMCLA